MVNEKGWVIINRKIVESDFWLSESFTKPQAWLDLIINTNHTLGSFWVQGIEIKLKRGQLGWSQVTMANRWGWSRGKVRRFLAWLENDQKIVQQTVQQKTTIITLLNYDKYQANVQQTVQPTVQLTDSRRYTNNNDNNDNNDIYKNFITKFNTITGKQYRVNKTNIPNLTYWLKTYKMEEIIFAVKLATKIDPWWKDKITPEKILRTRNQNGACDYIGDLLNKYKDKYDYKS